MAIRHCPCCGAQCVGKALRQNWFSPFNGQRMYKVRWICPNHKPGWFIFQDCHTNEIASIGDSTGDVELTFDEDHVISEIGDN